MRRFRSEEGTIAAFVAVLAVALVAVGGAGLRRAASGAGAEHHDGCSI